MKYRGLSSRTRLLRWGLLAALVAIVLYGTAGGALASLAAWLGTDSASLPWYGSRLFGFLAYGALTASVLYGLLLSTGVLDAIAQRTVSFTLHQELAALGLSLTAIHGALLALDTTVPTPVAAIIVPFAGSYRPLWVGSGQLAMLLSLAVYASFSVRRVIGQRRWRLVHYATFLAFAGATAHGLMTGSDSGSTWAAATYMAASVAVVGLLCLRLLIAVAGRLRHVPARVRVLDLGGD
jgi:sulfoxide reductase heme-binding subunit YedZ